VQRGILFILAAIVLFVGMDTIAKALTARYDVLQLVWARNLFHLLFIALLLGPRLARTLRTRNLPLQLFRSLLLTVTTGLFFLGLRSVQLAEASALMMATPLIVTALSVPLLGEKVGLQRWLCVLVGFVGALTILKPGSGLFQLAALLPLVAALSNGGYQISTRALARYDGPMTTILYTPVVGAVLASLLQPLVWTPPTAADWGLLALLGLFGGVGHYMLIRAYSSAPAATVAPFLYGTILIATISGAVVFGEFPDLWTIAGAVLLVGSGLYTFHREEVRRRQARRDIEAARIP